MNSSARITLAILLAGSALGVAVISACTVNSTTNNDTDGGGATSSSGSTGTSSGGTSSGGTSSGGTSSGGTSSGGSACATSKQDAGVVFRTAACQSCLNTKCCTQLTKCFNIPETTDNIDCNDYHNCIEAANGDTAKENLCDTVASDAGIIEAYQAIADCGNTNCKTECQ
jgi:hypothetical protein